jgi:hypothetical protein
MLTGLLNFSHMKKITFFGRVFEKEGKAFIQMDNKEIAAQLVREAMGGDSCIRVVFYQDEKEREKWVQSYYWAVVVPCIGDGVRDMGNDWNNERVHEFLRDNFTPKGSTKNLTTAEFKTYIEKCCKFAADLLGVVVPLPSTNNDKWFPN